MARVVLVEAQPRDTAGNVVTVRMAGGGTRGYDHRGATDWLAGVVSAPRFRAELGFAETGWTGNAVGQTGAITFAPSRQPVLDAVAAHYWPDAPVTIWTGDDAVAAPVWRDELVGTVAGIQISQGQATFTIATLDKQLLEPLCPDTFAGTGNLEGDSEALGRPKRLSWGECWQIEARLLLKAYNVYEVGDPAVALAGIGQVRDRGRAASDLVEIAWQGSAEETLAALIAASPPAGGAAVAPSIACIRWWTQPSGPLTADIRGAVSGGYVETPAEIAQRVIAMRTAITVADVAATKALRPGTAGLHVESETIAAALDRLLVIGCSIAWTCDPDGTVRLTPISLDGGEVLDAIAPIEREASYHPARRIAIGYRSNHRPMSDGEIAASLSADDIAYGDGTTVEEMKPADPSATNSALPDSPIADRTAKDLVDSVDINIESILAQALRQDELLQVFDARTLVEGQAVGTKFLDFRTSQQDENTATATALTLLGAKSEDGTAWNLNLDTVNVGGGKTMAQRLTEIGAVTDGASVSVKWLQEVLISEDATYAKSILRADADGVFGAFSVTADAVTRLSQITFISDEVYFVDPNGGNPLQVLSYVNNRWTFSADVYVQKLIAGSVETANLKAGSVTGLTSYSFPDLYVSSAEIVLAEVTGLRIGDGVDGRALALVSFTQDGSMTADHGMRIKAYVDVGSGYQVVRNYKQGIRVSDGNAQWSLPAEIQIPILSDYVANLKITAQAAAIGGGGINPGYARDILVTIFSGAR